jgi:ferric-dicitrate binding protein FerR (iron transport regulator)
MEDDELFVISRWIAAGITGEISTEQAARLEAWRKEHPAHEVLYRRLGDEHYRRDGVLALGRVDGDRALAVMRRRVRNARWRARLVAAVAAAAVVAVAAGIFYLSPRDARRFTPEELVARGAPRATLRLADGSVVLLDTLDGRVEQGGVEVAKSGDRQLSYIPLEGDEEGEKTLFNEVRVPRGGEFSLVLADGTRVWLNAGSRLRFPVNFAGEERRVTLAGEAYFDVTGDVERPFRVEVGACLVEVLGTEFNLVGYDDDPVIYATLVNGSVSFSNGRSSVRLVPGEQGVAPRSSGEVEKRRVNAGEIASWKDGVFSLEEQSLEEIMQKIARWYDVEVIFLDPTRRGITFKGRVPRRAGLDKVLLTLEKTGEVSFAVEGRTIIVYK